MAKLGKKGQSTVEYILLLAVLGLLTSNLFFGETFKKAMGNNSEIFGALRQMLESSYRHAYLEENAERSKYENYSSPRHPSYSQPSGNDSRFFLVSNPYGR